MSLYFYYRHPLVAIYIINKVGLQLHWMHTPDNSSPQSKLREMLNEPVGMQPIESILSKIQIQLITGLEQLVPPAYDFSELDKIFGKFERSRVSTKSQYARLILDIVIYFIKTMKDVGVNRQDYMRLQEQTQDIQNKIRRHIKNENKLRLEFDIRQRITQKLKGEVSKLKEENKSLKLTISDLQKRLHQQLKVFVSKMGNVSSKNSRKQFVQQKITLKQREHIKDPGEKQSHTKYRLQESIPFKYQEDFNNVLQDRRLRQTQYHIKDRHRSLQ